MNIYRQRINAKDIPAAAHTSDYAGPVAKRAPGAHVSSILRYVGTKTNLIPDYAPVQEDEAKQSAFSHGMNFMMMLGLAWESYLFRRIEGLHWQPGEIVQDGVAMNCDGLNLVQSPWLMPTSPTLEQPASWLEECKVTWQSATNPDLPGWYRLCQIMAYCHGFGLNKARLWIYHVRGDYKADFGPQLWLYWIEFTDDELRNNWRMVMSGKHEMESEAATCN